MTDEGGVGGKGATKEALQELLSQLQDYGLQITVQTFKAEVAMKFGQDFLETKAVRKPNQVKPVAVWANPDDDVSVAPPRPEEAAVASTTGAFKASSATSDPQWDCAGFEAWLAAGVPVVKVGYLRRLQSMADNASDPEVVPATELWFTLPPDCGVSGTQLFAVLSPSLLHSCTDPTAELHAIIEALGDASENDLVFWYHLCVELQSSDSGTSVARDGMFRMFTHYRVQAVLLPSVKNTEHTVFERLETMAYLSLATFCQRIVNASDQQVQQGLDLKKLVDLPSTLADLHCDGHEAFQDISDMLVRVTRILKPVKTDQVGFRVLCEESQIAWVRVPYLKQLAKRGGPCPRRQELNPDGIIVGRVPTGRKVSVSHGWASSYHIDPTGEKLVTLVQELERLGIDGEEDSVFIDFTGLWQNAPKDMPDVYAENNELDVADTSTETSTPSVDHGQADTQSPNPQHRDQNGPKEQGPKEQEEDLPQPLQDIETIRQFGEARSQSIDKKKGRSWRIRQQREGRLISKRPLADRSLVQQKQFSFALWGMSRMYTYNEVIVVVLPDAADPADFPVGPSAWGDVNSDPYHFRGWCTSEYSLARFTGRVANAETPAVQRMEAMREWPTTVEDYTLMMDPKGSRPVRFTHSGDRGVVIFLFFRICFGLHHLFVPDEWHKARLWQLPDESKLVLAEGRAIGTGNKQRAYHMHVAVQFPSTGVGDKTCSNALSNMQTALLTQEEQWVSQRKFPVVFSDATADQVKGDLVQGRVHSLVWSTPGSGWQREREGGAALLTVDTICETLLELQSESRPVAVFLCMQFGPEKVADRLADAGVPVVVWLGESLVKSGPAILLGVIAPMLDLLVTPRARGMGSPDLTAELHGLGRQVFGRSWQAGGVMLGVHPLPSLLPWQPSHAYDAGSPWVHQVMPAPVNPVPSAGTDELYESLKLVAVDSASGMQVDLLTFASPAELCGWLEETLPSDAGQRPTVQALYIDEDSSQQPTLQAQVLISSVGFLHELRDVALTGALDQSLSAAALMESKGLKIRMDRSQFCRMYEGTVLSLDKLTDHQTMKLNDCLAAETMFVHLKAPAGAGKTFVAMHMMLQLMQGQPSATILFVGRNVALCYFVVRWMARRVPNVLQRLQMLKRLHLLFEPFQEGPRAVSVRDNRIIVHPTESPDAGFSLVVVDESHHIYSHSELKDLVEVHVSDETRRLLISDISQSLGWDIDYPEGDQAEVMLTEVVRSTQRIVAGAGAFQLGDKKLLTTSQHNATGPPLKTFIFERCQGAQARLNAYVNQTVVAVKHVSSTLGDLDLHDRVAIVVPSAKMAAALRGPLEAALLDAFPDRPYQLLDAREAATVVAGSEGYATDGSDDGWLILDSIENFDGLERIAVICVDLDTAIEQSDALTTRSLIYRAMTRAHMLVVVVNEFLEGGWLAFMRTLKLEAEPMKLVQAGKQSMHADDREAVDRTTAEAKVSAVLWDADRSQMAQKKVATLLTKAIQHGLADDGLPLLDEHIVTETPTALERWHALLDACGLSVDAALQATKGGDLPEENTRMNYVLDAAFAIVRKAQGRLPADLGPSLGLAAEEAANVVVAQAAGWRTPAFYEQCREAALAIGWEMRDEHLLPAAEGGMDVGRGITNRCTGVGGWEKMSFNEAVADEKKAYDEIVRRVDAQGLEPSVATSILKQSVVICNAGAGAMEILEEVVQGQLASFEAERDAALGVQRQAVWDVESTANAPLGEVKFSPYPIKKERVEWLDSDGDLVGFELVDNRMYYLAYGKRFQPMGPGHIEEYEYPGGQGEGWCQYSDSTGFVGYNTIAPEAIPRVQAMWDIAEQRLDEEDDGW